MHVSVYDYYANRMALTAAGKMARRRPKPAKPKRQRARRSGPPWHRTWACRGGLFGLLAGELLWYAWLRQIPPAVTCTLLAAWGLILGMVCDWGLARVRKVMGILRGDRLTADDVRTLAGR